MSSLEDNSPWMLALGSAALFAFVYLFKPFGDDGKSDRYVPSRPRVRGVFRPALPRARPLMHISIFFGPTLTYATHHPARLNSACNHTRSYVYARVNTHTHTHTNTRT